ncbi:hypothetical protein [Sandarakinorhabdus sp.]|jgi:hypothetical protein|uniref:hypothetical protein n=1 Tax=Sandarakinorhabdus sp. TaxID=1916663 RepID=UPI003563C67B
MNMLPDPTGPDTRPRHAARNGERLRWGLTGLAAVFLIVMVAAASLRPAGRGAQPATGEPLALLGVAPGPATRPAEDQ